MAYNKGEIEQLIQATSEAGKKKLRFMDTSGRVRSTELHRITPGTEAVSFSYGEGDPPKSTVFWYDTLKSVVAI